MKLRYSPRALSDLAAISNYLTERSPAGARAVEQAIRSTVSLLEQFRLGRSSVTTTPRCAGDTDATFPTSHLLSDWDG
jgi:plasmid stabilization system protein ParE